jgi:hypothetical protein
MQTSGGFREGAFEYLDVGDVEDVGEGIARVKSTGASPKSTGL